ncbi:MAG: SDR family oxidoreductase [Gammaproteobacteria bacterium]
MSTVLITGANRGLGFEFCRQYAADDWRVVACCRDPDGAADLWKLADNYPNITIEPLNIADFASIDELSARMADAKLDVLINNAGVYGDTKGRGFGKLDYSAWSEALQINTLAPVKMAEAFLPQLERGNKRLIASVTSLMGSITDNTSGGCILYRSSKAALNAAMKTLAIDLKARSIGVLLLHPGWVRTDMGGHNALIDAQESVSGMCRVIEHFKPGQSGSFFKYDGKTLPW